MEIRPMTDDDVEQAERISDDAFFELDLATFPPSWPPPERRTPERSRRWGDRTRRFVADDPDGCWVAADETGVLGFATSFRREGIWGLATYAVRPGLQGRGVGRPLLEAAMSYGERCPRWMLSASTDPRALRRYHAAGFALHPQMVLAGTVDRGRLPVVRGVRPGTPDDWEWMDDLDRELRGGPHGRDHEWLTGADRLVVAADRTGYAYAASGRVQLLAARDEATARTLLHECLAGATGRFEVPHVTGVNRWAVDVGLDVRLDLAQSGFLGLRGMDPPAPYVHNGALL